MATHNPILCGCKIVKGKIVFCALHARAEKLLAVIEHLRQFLGSVQLADEKDNNRLQKVILPYVHDQIQRARKDIKAIGGR